MEKNELLLPEEIIMNKIYLIRGQKVMLDKDLAGLYQVSTTRLNQQVNRNLKRFPHDFMFQLNEQEFESLMLQNATSKGRGGTRKLPFAFTEQGVAMLSSVLSSDVAIAVNIQIIRTFTKIRQSLLDNTELRLAIEKLIKKTDNNTKNIELLFHYFDELTAKQAKPKPPMKKIGYRSSKK